MWCSAVGCIVTLTLSLLAAPLAAEAQGLAKRLRIGYLPAGDAADGEAIRQGLRDLGYIEGQNITIETRDAEENLARLPDLAAELVRLQVDVIVAVASPAIQAAKHATSTIPIVMATGGPDPVGAGLVASLARPGGNVTGVALGAGEQFVGKWVELLKEAVPQVSRVAVLWDPTRLGMHPMLAETERAARGVGLRLQLLEARRVDAFDSAFAAMTREGAEALIVLSSAQFAQERKRIVVLVAESRLPAIYEHRAFVDAGGLMSYGANVPALKRRAAYYVDQLVKGAKPADLPVEQPMKFELVINLKTAQALGLTIPPTLLFLADEVIR